MQKLFFISLVLFSIAIQTSSAQTRTIVIRPHFNGKESLISRIDTDCMANSTIDSPRAISPIIAFMAWTSSGCELYTRGLIRFDAITDTSVIPSGSTINAAELFLYEIPSTTTGDYGNSTYPGSPYNGYGTNTGYIYELAAPFNPLTTSWRTQPNYLHSDSIHITASNSHWGTDVDSFNVTSMVRHLYTSGNYGFLIKIDTEVYYREHLYGSSRYADSNFHPALRITYTKGAQSVSELINSEAVQLFPNPVSDILNLNLDLTQATSFTACIYNILGQKLQRCK